MTNKSYHNLTDRERERLNLPPVGFQGEEFMTIIQAPTSKALQTRINQFRLFAKQEHYETFEILQHGRDPDGGYKAVLTAHNWNPLTWASEKAYRTYLGAKHGLAVGRQKAAIKHQVGVTAELARAAEEEKALAKRRLAIRQAVEAEKLKAAPAQAVARTRIPLSTAYKLPKETFADLNETIFGPSVLKL